MTTVVAEVASEDDGRGAEDAKHLEQSLSKLEHHQRAATNAAENEIVLSGPRCILAPTITSPRPPLDLRLGVFWPSVAVVAVV